MLLRIMAKSGNSLLVKSGVTVIVPCYNSEEWIASTIHHIEEAIKYSGIKQAEIIIVDDGSVDNTKVVSLELTCEYPIKLISQKNKGRFLARKAGLEKAKYGYILFIDSRVHLHRESLDFVMKEQIKHPERLVWNGHVYVQKRGNVIARFGDAITFIGWRKYFGNPRTCQFGLDDFDYYPKGTGCFLTPKNILVAATQQFLNQTKDVKNSSDDTLLIRLIASDEKINLSPGFSCDYFARTKLRQFIKHSYNRGKFFVDGFLRSGTRFYYPLILFLFGSVVFIVLPFISASYLVKSVIILSGLWIAEFVIAISLRTPLKDAASLWILSPIFSICYGLGIWRAFIKRTLGI